MLKKFAPFGVIVPTSFYMPYEGAKDAEMTLGFAFIEYTTAEAALEAIRGMNGHVLDKKHTLRVYAHRDFERLMNHPDEFVPPAPDASASAENPRDWLLDEHGRDQFVVRHGDETEIWWHDPIAKGRQMVYAGEREKEKGQVWTELYVQWSPKGSMLATFHAPGVMLWAGRDFQRVGRFQHHSVKIVDFSPNEKYLITTNGAEAESTIIWDIRSGRKVKAFGAAVGLPRWSHDDAFFAILAEDRIDVYDAATMQLLEDKPIKAPGVRDVQWSPAANVLSFWQPDMGNAPARVSLLEIPSRAPVREKGLVYVADVKMHWHASGSHLLVKVTRQNPLLKKPLPTMFEIFSLDERNCPVDSFEMKDTVHAFGWEPKGKRFALIHAAEEHANAKNKNVVSFYSIKSKKFVVESSLEARTANALFWSPAGNNIVLATFKSGEERTLEFYDANRKEVMAVGDHPLVTDVEWDPAGRYIFSQVNMPTLNSHVARDAMDNGYKAWTCKGQLVYQTMIDRCYQILWRPRPATLLPADEVASVRKQLKDKYSRRFETADAERTKRYVGGEALRRMELRDAWRATREEQRRTHQATRDERRELRGGAASDDEADYVEIEVVEEIVLDTKTENYRE